MKLNSLEDLLLIDHLKLKADDNKRIITKIKALLKLENKASEVEDIKSENLPYEGVGIVGNTLVHLKFDLKTKNARVVDTEVDSRDTRNRNYMSGAKGVTIFKDLVKNQKVIK